MASPKLNCLNCIYFAPADTTGSTGDCRRFPPIVVFDNEEGAFLSAFPTIDNPNNNYCGECTVPEEETL